MIFHICFLLEFIVCHGLVYVKLMTVETYTMFDILNITATFIYNKLLLISNTITVVQNYNNY